MNILAIGAHPDDIETSCGGTLAKYAKMGHKVFTATATNGNVGSATLSMEEIAAIRKEEARRAAAHIGAEYICLDYDDEMFFEDKAARLAFIDLVRYCKADVILTHNPEDYNPDHELTSKIINDIAVMIPVEKIKTKNPAYDKIPIIAYFEPVNGLGFVPTDYVDITDTMGSRWLCVENIRARFLGCRTTIKTPCQIKISLKTIIRLRSTEAFSVVCHTQKVSVWQMMHSA